VHAMGSGISAAARHLLLLVIITPRPIDKHTFTEL